MTLWVTFVPSFLFVLTGAPYIERLRGSRWIKAALSTVTAAVAGIILNLAAWFAIHVIFPAPGRIDYFALGLSAAVPGDLERTLAGAAGGGWFGPAGTGGQTAVWYCLIPRDTGTFWESRR